MYLTVEIKHGFLQALLAGVRSALRLPYPESKMRFTCLHTILFIPAGDTFWKEHIEYFSGASILGKEENLTEIGNYSRIGPEAEE